MSLTIPQALVICVIGSSLLTVCESATSAEPKTQHTYQLTEGEARPGATLDDADWLAGSWSGTAFGAKFEEVWNAPSAGSMVGLFKLYDDEGVKFYELLLLEIDEGTLSLKVKHFNADFSAWEEKPDYVNFRLVKKEEGALHFGGISFYRRNSDSIDGYIVMRNGEEISEHHLKYQRNSRFADGDFPVMPLSNMGGTVGENE